ncbi:tetratricopeptide repeat protein, partial [Oligoflexia bacterium]|nr:tetratricopeptide repeat protein [Oligoflexia bacterium]
ASHPPRFHISIDLGLKVLLGDITEKERLATLSGAGTPKISDARKKAQRLLSLAENLRQRKNVEKAIATAAQALEVDPTFVEGQVVLGELLILGNRIEVAHKHLVVAVEKARPPHRAQLGLAIVLARQGKDDEALKMLNALKVKRVDKNRLYYELGRIYQKQGKTAEALESYRKAAEAALEMN